MKDGGSVIIDHRDSPGLTAEQARLAGYDPKHCGEGAYYEAGTLTCKHCKSVVVKNKFRVRERAFCGKCSGFICDACHAESTLPLYVHKSIFNKIDDLLTGAP
jgi:hypothetical protein